MEQAKLRMADETPATLDPTPEPTTEPSPSPSPSEAAPSMCGMVETPCYVHVPDDAPEFFASSLVLVVLLLSAILAAQLRRP